MIISLKGGIDNQLFQYALLALKNNDVVKLYIENYIKLIKLMAFVDRLHFMFLMLTKI